MVFGLSSARRIGILAACGLTSSSMSNVMTTSCCALRSKRRWRISPLPATGRQPVGPPPWKAPSAAATSPRSGAPSSHPCSCNPAPAARSAAGICGDTRPAIPRQVFLPAGRPPGFYRKVLRSRQTLAVERRRLAGRGAATFTPKCPNLLLLPIHNKPAGSIYPFFITIISALHASDTIWSLLKQQNVDIC